MMTGVSCGNHGTLNQDQGYRRPLVPIFGAAKPPLFCWFSQLRGVEIENDSAYAHIT